MGNMCCRREMYAPNGTETDQSRCGHQQQIAHLNQQHPSKQQPQQHPAMSNAYHSAGDDCAINELLEGRMDLDVLMPDGRQVRLTVERRTPMMDLLVQTASATKISPGGHVIHVFAEGDKGNGTLQYKPSTPIGSLDTKTICIVPKKEAGDPLARRLGKTATRPFEPTFRVQVHLPRNQLTVLRVSPRIKISELKSMVCKEKGLDTSRYQLVRPSGPTQPLAGDMTLAEYGSTEITLLSNSSIESHISTSHIIPYSKRAEDQKRKNGILRLLTEDVKNKVNENSNSNSTCHVDGKQKTKTSKMNEVNVHQHRFKPKKRRPAPPPPPPVLPEAPSHSRQSSSDSSGYHEATSSFLHEEHSGEEKASSDSSGVSSLDAKGPSIQLAAPPIPNPKKKKAPAPPPPSVQKDKLAQKETVLITPSSTRNNAVQRNSVDLKKPVIEISEPLKDTTDLNKPPVEDSILQKDAVVHKETNLDADLLKKDCVLNQKNCIIQEDSLTVNDSVVISNQREVSSEPSVKVPLLASEPAIPKCSTSSKDPIVRNNAVNLQEGLLEKDHLAQNIRSAVRDQIPPKKDYVIPSDHVILKDQVLKRDAEKKLDLPHLRESEGRQLQPQMTVAAKAPPTANAPADSTDKGESKCEVSSLHVEKQEAVPDAYKCKTSHKKLDRDQTSCKSEALSTRVALVALNARIEQDVTQQEIASSIQAAFHSLDCSAQPSLLAIKQRNCEDPTVHSARGPEDFPVHSPEHSEPPRTATTVRVPLNLNSDDDSCRGTSPKFCAPEREALLIDEELPPRPVSTGSASSKNLKRSSSLLNFAEVVPRNNSAKSTKRVRHLQRSLSDLSADGKEDFEAEQDRLQREYIKLQRQFILWQQQLMNNHVMLREECIVPQYARTLRQSHSLPEGEDYSDDAAPSGPLVSRSLSYEPTKERCSTLPRSAINITSFEFGSIPVNSGTSTLRSSKTKNYFKPPQIRASTKSRQRLPPEIKKEGDVDITDDTKMLTTILPSFESLKLITENNDEDIHSSFSRLKDTISATKATPSLLSEVKKIPFVHQSSTFPKINSRLNNGDKSADKDLKYVNGDTGQSKLPVDCPKVTEQSLKSQPPPPPPPPPPTPPVPVEGLSKCSVNENCVKSMGQRNGVGKKDLTPQVDPRERLMLEIRKFGGRTALRKISLAS